MSSNLRKLLFTAVLLAEIHQVKAQLLTNIIVSPTNPAIGTAGSQQFTATGQYDDGSWQTLTNNGSASNWVFVASMPGAKSQSANAAANGLLYVTSGGDQNLYAYNPAANSWTTKSPFINSWCAYSSAVGIGSKIYVMGGCVQADCGHESSALTVYDTQADSWSNAAPMNVARSAMAAAAINGKIYIAGGYDGSGNDVLNSLEVYDPGNNVWAFKTPMPIACRESGSATIDGLLYVVGGLNASPAAIGTLQVYNPTNDSWTTKSPMPTPRSDLGAVAVGGLLYAIDGQTSGGLQTNLVEVYNPASDSWSTGIPTLIAHNLSKPVAIHGAIFIAGAGANNSSSSSAETYTAQGLAWSSSDENVATIDTNGLVKATGVATGPTTITATSGAISGNTLLTVVVSAPNALNYSLNPVVYTKGVTIIPDIPSYGGGAPTSFSVNPDLPAGLTLNQSTGVITGAPTVASPYSSYIVTATNIAGSTSTTLYVTVNDVAPSALSYSSNPVTYTNGISISPNTPSNSGGAATSFSVSPALPPGLTLNTTTGFITGTPTAVVATASYTVTASNSGGSTQSYLTITVIDAAPALSLAAANNQSVLFWPISGTNYILQSATNLASTNWVTATDAVPVMAFTVTNSSPARFFRLQRQ